jgi:CheY-like chemotaxis protein
MTTPPDQTPAQTNHLSDIQLTTAPLTMATTGPLDLTLPWVIEMRIVGTPSTLQVQVRETMLIGRGDIEQQIFPEIDLLSYNGFALGVSRKHAVIETQEGRLYLKDLNSTNGTRLNNVPLQPFEQYRLRHGDQIMFGQMKVQVLFAVVPNHDQTGRYIKTGALQTQTQELARLAHNKTVLIVEDDPNVAEVFRLMLERAGYKVTIVNSVVNALSVVLQKMPDAIVLDLMLPDFNGLDFLRYVRKNNPTTHVPVIVVSASSSSFQTAQAIEAGADAFLAKPVSVEDLIATVTKAVGLSAPTPVTSE